MPHRLDALDVAVRESTRDCTIPRRYPYPDVKLQYFAAPQTSDSFDKVLQHVEQTMQGDSPLAFGFHPNAEIGFRTDQSEQLCLSILDLGAGDEASGEEGACLLYTSPSPRD